MSEDPSFPPAPTPLPHSYAEWDEVNKRISSLKAPDQTFSGLNFPDYDNLVQVDFNTRQFICSQALEICELFPEGSVLFSQICDSEATSVFTQRQILCLLCHAFLDTIPKMPEKFDGQRLTLKRWLLACYQPVGEEKIKCFMNYICCCKARIDHDSTWIGTKISISRKRLLEANTNVSEEMLLSSTTLLSPIIVRSSSDCIEDCEEALQADFANEYIGGGVLGGGCVQEEIRFCVSPECLVSILVCECMSDNEAILIRGAQTYSKYYGYGFGFKYNGASQEDVLDVSLEVDCMGFRKSLVLALDATPYPENMKWGQYQRKKIIRDLKKCYVALSPWQFELQNQLGFAPFATGNWGCGAFNGDPHLKSIQQWIVASLCERGIVYFPHNDTRMVEFDRVAGRLFRADVSVKDLCKHMFDYGDRYFNNTNPSREGTFFEFLLQQTADETITTANY